MFADLSYLSSNAEDLRSFSKDRSETVSVLICLF